MSSQDPLYGSPPGSLMPAEAGHGDATDAAKLKEAGETVRSDLRSAFETAKNDFQAATDTAKRDFANLKDQAVGQVRDITGQAGDQASSLKDQAVDQVQRLTGQAQGQLQSLKGQAQDQLNDATGKAKAYATEQVSQLTDQARSFAAEQKGLAARQLGGVVDAVSRVADDLQSSQNGTAVAGYAQDLAGGLRNLADTLQNKSVEELFGMVQDFGRRQPMAFLGIAALTGFAASRFIMASRNRQPESAPQAQGFRPDASPDDRRFERTAVELDRDLSAGGANFRGVGDNVRG